LTNYYKKIILILIIILSLVNCPITNLNQKDDTNGNTTGGDNPTTQNKVATPVFSIKGGTYNSAQNVTISCLTDKAIIYYTTDGTNPTKNSNLYTESITINSSTTLKAFAVKNGMENSEIATCDYTIDTSAPSNVTGLMLKKRGDKYLIFSWLDPSDADLKNIEVDNITTGAVATVNPGIENITINVPVNSSTYFFKIYSVDLAGNKSTGLNIQAQAQKPYVSTYVYNSSDKLDSYSLYEYNLNNQTTKFSTYNGSDELQHYTIWEYNSNNQMVRYSYYNSTGQLQSYTVYEYNSNNQFFNISSYDSTDQLQNYFVCEYNSNNQLFKISYYNGSNELQNYTVYEYNSNNQLSKFSSYNGSDELQGYWVWEYNTNNQLSRYSNYDSTGQLQSYIKYEYNLNNQISKISTYNGADELQNYSSYEYNINSDLYKISYFNGLDELQNYTIYNY